MPTRHDQTEASVSFIDSCLRKRDSEGSSSQSHRPLFVGFNGVQGSGKTTLVSAIAEKLRQDPRSLSVLVFSIDDLYLPHGHQAELAAGHPSNPLIKHRGQPSTHDLPLALSLFSNLRSAKETKVPAYDKSAYNGQGDRRPESCWQVVNQAGRPPIEVVLFEGWCVGFRALSGQEIGEKWETAVRQEQEGNYQGRLGKIKFEDVKFINEALKSYDQLTVQLDALIHLDAADPRFAYRWREEQERKMRETKGTGMTDEQVRHFVDGYYPAYELFTERLRAGILNGSRGSQLRLIIDEDRQIKEIIII